ncbi:acyl-CoA dehydrogenase family protein [Aquimarina sp. RZ0]|uniref:acyl-CoA dehydrogenase family protein n=1 Tax=Aquimarina sp. RZ0 TaxID=2607730 RepID=UPI0011F3D1E2|nr:acyl-CoA dehydrogenase family protein [Aquimarina sp. RZ0]KAA1243799.1 acyl-CoA dehydrogenase [Aquimarina sp. RZ0]
MAQDIMIQETTVLSTKKEARELAQKIFSERVNEVDKKAIFPSENIEDLKNHGFLNLGLPQNPAGVKSIVEVIEEISQGCPSTAVIYLMHISLLPTLYKMSSENQKQTILKSVFEGKMLGSYSQSEKSTGARAWYVESFAKKEKGHYLIDCFKSFSTGSGYCDFYSVITRDHKDASDSELAIFYVDADDPNVKVIGEWDAMGLKGTSSTPIFFDKVRAPYIHKIGEGQVKENVFYILMAFTHPIYMIGLSAIFYGIAKRAYEEAVKYVNNRTYNENGKIVHLKELGVMHNCFAEMKVLLDTTKRFLDSASESAEKNTLLFERLSKENKLHDVIDKDHEQFFSEQSQLKILCTESAIKVTNMAMEVMGGSGYKSGSIIERCYRDVRAGSLMNPSNNTLKMILGRLELGIGLPWE